MASKLINNAVHIVTSEKSNQVLSQLAAQSYYLCHHLIINIIRASSFTYILCIVNVRRTVANFQTVQPVQVFSTVMVVKGTAYTTIESQ